VSATATATAARPRSNAACRADEIVAAFEACSSDGEVLRTIDRALRSMDAMRGLPEQEHYQRCCAARDAAYQRLVPPPAPAGLPLVDGEGLLHHLCGQAPGETDVAVWSAEWARLLRVCPSLAAARALRDANAPHLAEVAKLYPLDAEEVRALIEATIRGPKGGKPSYG